MELDERDYREKNQWRRWIWNRCVSQLAVTPADATVIYLPGAADLDRDVAIAKGFKQHNLVPVERSSQKIRSLRGRGIRCIGDDILVVAQAWDKPIHVLMLDFCCGLERKLALAITPLLMRPHMRNAVIALNLMRGRDPSSSDIRDFARDAMQVIKFPNSADLDAIDPGINAPKHRGLLLHYLVTLVFTDWITHAVEKRQKDLPQTLDHCLRKLERPAVCSYRSTTSQTFDSIVFRNPASVLLPSKLSLDREKPARATSRKIAAFRAWQTMALREPARATHK